MSTAINENAIYLRVMFKDRYAILVDMNDIAKIGFGEKVRIEGDATVYTVSTIEWKIPYSDRWMLLIDDAGVELWNNFCSKPSKNVDK